MRKWLVSVFFAAVGIALGWWWFQEKQDTQPVLRVPPTPPAPRPPKPDPVPAKPASEEGAAPAPNSPSVAAEVTQDPLTEINGIGPAFEEALNAIGIYTFAQLAQQNPKELAERISARVTAERIERDAWIEQARQRRDNTG